MASNVFDLLVMQGVGPTISPGIVDLSFGNSGKRVNGVQLAVQQWLMCLFTNRGSVRSAPDYGTSFISDAKKSNIHDISNLRDLFNSAALDVKTWFEANPVDTRDTDELVKSATLLSCSVLGTKATFVVQLDTADGDSVKYTVPTTLVNSN